MVTAQFLLWEVYGTLRTTRKKGQNKFENPFATREPLREARIPKLVSFDDPVTIDLTANNGRQRHQLNVPW
jgi:hypothetical protein